MRRCPNPFNGPSEIEIRQVFEAADFDPEFMRAARAHEARLRAGAAQH